jgi:hypothetical protein
MLSYWLTACVTRAQILHLTRGYRPLPLAYVLYNMAPLSDQGRLKVIGDYLCNVYLCYLGANQWLYVC